MNRNIVQMNPDMTLDLERTQGSLVTQHRHVRRLGRVAPDLSRLPSGLRAAVVKTVADLLGLRLIVPLAPR